jgi:hypothetical protein
MTGHFKDKTWTPVPADRGPLLAVGRPHHQADEVCWDFGPDRACGHVVFRGLDDEHMFDVTAKVETLWTDHDSNTGYNFVFRRRRFLR